MRHTRVLLLAILCLLALAVTRASAQEPSRPWATGTGKVVYGKLIAFEAGTVFIKADEDGKVVRIKLEFLSEEDQDYYDRRRDKVPTMEQARLSEAKDEAQAAARAEALAGLPPITRTWTRADGKTVDATYAGLLENAVVLERDGRQFHVPLSMLAAEDQAIARRFAVAAQYGPLPTAAPEPAPEPVPEPEPEPEPPPMVDPEPAPAAPVAGGVVLPVGIVRTWTNAESGKTVLAEFIGLEEGSVLLKKGDRGFKVPLDSLSDADRTFIDTVRSGAAESPPAATGNDDESLFSDSPDEDATSPTGNPAEGLPPDPQTDALIAKYGLPTADVDSDEIEIQKALEAGEITEAQATQIRARIAIIRFYAMTPGGFGPITDPDELAKLEALKAKFELDENGFKRMGQIAKLEQEGKITTAEHTLLMRDIQNNPLDMPEETKAAGRRAGHMAMLIGLSCLVYFCGTVWLSVLAFGESAGMGLLVLLLPVIGPLVYGVKDLKRTKVPLIILAAGSLGIIVFSIGFLLALKTAVTSVLPS